jgi:holin-like protein
MNYILQLTIILGVSFLGEVLNALIPLPIPAAVYGLVLLFLALITGVVKVEKVRAAGNWLIGIMGVFFVAPVVNLLDSWASVRRVLLPVLGIVVLSTVIVFAVAGKVTQWLRRKGGNHD